MTSTTDPVAAAFLADIIAHPDEDAPRLIYADWLEDHGDSARAEFIRCQIEEARLPEGDARRAELARRGKELLNGKDTDYPWYPSNLYVWGRPADGFVLSGGVKWRRGFIESLHVLWRVWAAHVSRLMASHPIRRVDFADKPDMRFRRAGKKGSQTLRGRLKMNGCNWRVIKNLPGYRAGIPQSDVVLLLLADQWPGVTFTWPGLAPPAPPPLS